MKIIYFALVFVLFSCKTTKNSKKEIPLNGNYKVVKIKDLDTLSILPTLKLDSKKNTASGFAGCNRFSCKFKQDTNKIGFKSIISTEMYCDNMKIENTFLKYLSKATKYKILNNKILFYNNANDIVIELKETAK